MNEKKYDLPNGKTAVFNYDENGVGKITLECLDILMEKMRYQWVSCSERLPEDGTEVFVYLFESKAPYIAWVEDCRWYTEDFEVEKENYPIAWMPLPESYRGDNNA